MPSIDRRTFLGAVAAGSVAGLAGCSSSCPDSGTPEPETVLRNAESAGPFESVPDGAWPQPRYDPANTGYSPDVAPPAGSLRVRWRAALDAPEPGDVYSRASSPVVAGGRVLATTAAGVQALSLRDGSTAWRHGGVVPGTTGPTFGYGQEFATPAVADGTAFVGGRDAVVALDLADGTERWRHEGPGPFGTPRVADGTVFVGTSGEVTALDARGGSERWSVDVGNQPVLPAVAEGAVVVHADGTVALEASSGERRWTVDREPEHYPVVADGTVYVGGYEGLTALDLADGSEQWTFDRGGGRSLWSPVLAPDTIYTVEQPGEAGAATFALDRTDGKPEPRWCSYIGEGAVTGAAGGLAFALQSGSGGPDERAPVRLVAFGDRLGDSMWGYADREFLMPPAILDGAVVAVDRRGTVVAIGGEPQ